MKTRENRREWSETMTYDTATAYGCVAYRIMKYEGKEQSEEYLGLLMEILYDFYSEREIQKICLSDIQLDSYDAVVNDYKIKQQLNE